MDKGIQIALVVGGGNVIRGARVSAAGWIDRATGDSLGMMATVMNSLALETALNAAGVTARTMSAVSMPTICETYARQPALHHLDKGQVVVLAGGTGNPYFTTDTAAVLRARRAEMRRGAEGDAGRRGLFRRSEDQPGRRALRAPEPRRGDRPRPQGDGQPPPSRSPATAGLPLIVGSVHAPSSVTAILTGAPPSTLVAP